VTVDPLGTTENQIRIELVVYDSAGKFSEKHRMYFVVVPDGFGDAEPIVQLNTNGLNDSKVDTDTITISGTVLSGAESEKDVFVEVAFTEDAFTSTPKQQFNLTQRGLWVKSPALGDSDSFELTLNLDEMYTNKSRDLRIFIKIFEGDTLNQRWVTIKWLEIQLPACQGLQADEQAEAAGGEFILDENGECQWSGAWTYDPETGIWKAPSTTVDNGDSTSSGIDTTYIIIGVIVFIAILGSLLFLRKGDEEKQDMFDSYQGGFEQAASLDPTEQYVQQLIAQGYPEETARAFAAQYAAQSQAAAQPVVSAQQAVAAQPAAGYDQGIYEQYYNQFVSQGYDPATAGAYAQQYAIQYAQSQQ